MTFKRGDKVWVGAFGVKHPAVLHDPGRGISEIGFWYARFISGVGSTPFAEFEMEPRTEHIPELDGEEAPRG